MQYVKRLHGWTAYTGITVSEIDRALSPITDFYRISLNADNQKIYSYQQIILKP